METLANDSPAGAEELPGGAPVAVRDLLRLPALASARVVAGAGGLDRVVTRANIMEVPDILPWVKPDELLLTTGYPLRGVPGTLAGLVADLDEAGVAAMGVKLRRYLDELPADMVAEADRRGFPLLLLAEDVAFDDLLNAVLGDVLNRQSTVLERSELVQRALVAAALDGGGLDDVVDVLNAVTGDLVFVTTTDGRVLAEAGSAAGRDALHGGELFERSGRFRSERFAAGAHEVGGVSVAVLTVVVGKVDQGRLVVARTTGRMSDGDLHVLGRAATVIGLVISKSLAVRAVEAKYRADFVRDVLVGRASPHESVADHFASLGWTVSRPLVVTVAQLDLHASPTDLTPPERRVAQERFAAAWVNVVGRHDRSAPVVGFANEVVTLVGVPPGQVARDVVAGLVAAVRGDGGGGRNTFATGVSRLVGSPAELPAGFEQARRAVLAGRQMQGKSAFACFDDLGAFRLLSLIEDGSELRSFATGVLGQLADERDPEAADLRRTLRVLLDSNLNVAETSRRLHFHYNTLRYRIGKLERLVGPFCQDADLRLDLALALRVLQMRGQ